MAAGPLTRKKADETFLQSEVLSGSLLSGVHPARVQAENIASGPAATQSASVTRTNNAELFASMLKDSQSISNRVKDHAPEGRA